MISFILCIIVLVAGYILYGKFVSNNFNPDDRITPAVAINDGVDYTPLPLWKLYLIQLLNIAGTGPIFGALSGAVFGPIVYVWIVFGCIFAGAVHDYNIGMISMRHNGANISEVVGLYLGDTMKSIMRVFSIVLLIMCGVVFTTGPAGLLSIITPEKLNTTFWLWVIIAYYFVATFLPIDKLIGKLYPVFGVCLIIMSCGVGGSLLFSEKFVMPELWANFTNMHAAGTKLWPFMFITVACGAISGFHATQSPLMARCCISEKEGQLVFYGAMITEGVIALVWAAAGVSCYENSQALLAAGSGCSAVVYYVCNTTMGKVGALLAMLGVIVCPISSGDTAYRAARLTIADWFNVDQSDWKRRLFTTIPILAVGAIICRIDYTVVWRYFAWSNQTLAMIALWAAAEYLRRNGRNYAIVVVPALFMSAVSVTYFFSAGECLGILWNASDIPESVYYPIAIAAGVCAAALFLYIFIKKGKKESSVSLK